MSDGLVLLSKAPRLSRTFSLVRTLIKKMGIKKRSHTGISIYCNSAPIMWYSKAQSSVETSTFGSEFVAL